MNASGDVKANLTEYLRELHLPAIRQCFEEKARQAERETLSYEQYLLDLAERECQERRENRITRLLRESKLPLEKTMENFDLKRLPAKAARQVKALLDGAFLDRKENVLSFGNPGSGKTHLLSALGQELIRNGRKIGFITCARLVQDLLRAKKELRLSRAIQKLANYEGLVIDDLGYVQQSREEMEVLFSSTGGSASRPPGFIAFLPSQVVTVQPAGRSDVRPLLVWPRSQRSGCIPAEPYPRSGQHQCRRGIRFGKACSCR